MFIRNLPKSALLSLGFVLFSAVTAQADDRTGMVSEVILDQTSYMALRVKLAGVSSFCSGGSSAHTAYLAADKPHYDSVVRLLLAAQISGKEVLIKSSKDGSYCRIQGVRLLD